MRSLRAAFGQRQILAFLAIAFALSWLLPAALLLLARTSGAFRVDLSIYSPVYYVGVWSPAIAAMVVVFGSGGVSGLRAFLRRIARWRAALRWYVLALVAVPGAYLAAALIWRALGYEALGTPSTGWLATALLTATAGPLEEIGWRGYALPRLQRHLGGTSAALALGIVWALWHLPIFVVGGFDADAFAIFTVQILAVSLVLSVFFNGSAGCVPLAVLIHWLTNFPYPWEGEADLMIPQTFTLMLLAGLLLATRGEYLKRERLVRA